MFSIYDLLWWLIAIAAGAWWWRSSGQKQQVLTFARQYCQDRGLQLLDQTLVFHRFRLGTGTRMGLLRLYEFDFSSDGENRFRGEIALQGNRITRIVLEGETVEVTEY